ncbi:hypothetical protein Q2468_27260, partial [Escherichia coli]|nr:hypothetical protein [Escherichia coli]
DHTISGQVAGATAAGTATVTRGGAADTPTMEAILHSSADVVALALLVPVEGGLTISASGTKSLGNNGNGPREITNDANLPGLR